MSLVLDAPDLEGHDALLAEVDLLDELPFLPVVYVEVGPVVPRLHVSQVQAGRETSKHKISLRIF